MMKRFLLAFVLATLLPGVASARPAPEVKTVVGRLDPAKDRQSIQTAIDGSLPGDTIELVGSFQFDGKFVSLEKPEITLQGRIEDNDGDGKANEDWADGIDNDGDGAIDEDDWEAVLLGVAGVEGRPDPGPPLTLFNRAVVIDALPKDYEGIVIRGIKFSTFHRAVDFSADHTVPDGALCSDVVKTAGSALHPRVEANWFHNNGRGVQIFGSARGARIETNLFTDNATGILLVGGEAYCRSADGSDSTFAVGTPKATVIANNRMVDSAFGLVATPNQQTEIRGNEILPDFAVSEDEPDPPEAVTRGEGGSDG
jgi:hypothetical protein